MVFQFVSAGMEQHSKQSGSKDTGRGSTARKMAEQLARGFKAHDKGRRDIAIDAFTYVDRHQFQFLGETDARHASTAFVEALWKKDDIELDYLRGGQFDRDGLRQADYRPVRQKLRERATIIGIDPQYATTKAKAWRRHKAGGDYWTPFGKSQLYEIRRALRDPEYPNKPRAGDEGFGPDPCRYVLAFELHDMKTDTHWQQGVDVMVPYFKRILEANENDE
ncbi:hypothetical protein [Halapricum desulfuricans]|nr:hypothetical protein [Halapricum desulfuricans]